MILIVVSLCGELLCRGIRDHAVSASLMAIIGESLNIKECFIRVYIFFNY